MLTSPEGIHRGGDTIDCHIDVIDGRRTPEAEADRRAGAILSGADRLEHVRGRLRSRGACRSRGDRDAVERHQQRLSLDTVETHMEIVWQPMLHRSVDADVCHVRAKALEQQAAQRREAPRLFRHLEPADLGGTPEPDDARDVQGARPKAVLLSTAFDLRGQDQTGLHPADKQRARSFRAVELVGGHRQEIDGHRVHIERNLACGLRGIGVQQHAA